MPPGSSPRLLVSVRSVTEARAALDGGCDILDVKEPSRGPLGMADVSTIHAVARLSRPDPSEPHCVPVSAALGELHQWRDAPPALPAGLQFVKLGLCGMCGVRQWPSVWRDVRRRFDEAAGHPLRWVAVVYADGQPANAPLPEEVIAAAVETHCAAVLFDTFQKTGRGLLDWLPPARLASLAESIHRHGLPVALAGSLEIAALPRLADIRPDIVAIRGAACRDGRRDGEVCPDRVHAFRAALHTASAPIV